MPAPDYEAAKQRALAHLVLMAKTPGWKSHAWWQAQQWARDCPQLWKELPALLTAAMKEGGDADANR